MKIGLLYELDGLANSTRAFEIKEFLTRNNYEVEIINICKIKFEPKKYYRDRKSVV